MICGANSYQVRTNLYNSTKILTAYTQDKISVHLEKFQSFLIEFDLLSSKSALFCLLRKQTTIFEQNHKRDYFQNVCMYKQENAALRVPGRKNFSLCSLYKAINAANVTIETFLPYISFDNSNHDLPMLWYSSNPHYNKALLYVNGQ